MAFIPANKLNGIDVSVIRQWNAKKKPNTINLGIGELPWEAPQAFRDAGANAFSYSQLKYTPNAGLPKLREGIANEFGKYIDKKVMPEQVIVTAGVEEALSVTFGTFLNTGDNVIIPEINFEPYRVLPRLNGAIPRIFRLNYDFSLNLEDLESKIDEKTKLVVINSPGNPTGKVLDDNNLIGLSGVLNRHKNLYVLSDEIYSHLHFQNEVPRSIAEYTDRFVVVNGLSKRASAAGSRLGWMISQPEVINQAVKLHQYTVSCAPTPSQLAAIPVLEGKTKSEELVLRMKLMKNRDYAYNYLMQNEGINLQSPQGAFFMFADISKYGNSEEVAQRILDKSNVLVIPGIAFGSAGDKYIRISYAVNDSDLIDGIKGISGALK